MDFRHALLVHLEHHIAFYSASFSALCVAIICTMPKDFPKTVEAWWTWIRDALQTAVPAARNHTPTTPTPAPQEVTQPEKK